MKKVLEKKSDFMWFNKPNRKKILERCNFRLAAREIARYFELSNQEAQRRRGEYIYKEEFINGWIMFAENPGYKTAIQFLESGPEYESFVLKYLADCCPDGKLYRHGHCSAAEFRLGDYRLDMRLQDIVGLREFTKDEYALFGRESLQEVAYHGNPTEFLGRIWDMKVGTIEGKIYQLGASLAFDAKNTEKEMVRLTREVYEHCEVLFGTPTEETKGWYIWDTTTGKMTFQFAVIQETDIFAANIFVGDKGDQRYGNS